VNDARCRGAGSRAEIGFFDQQTIDFLQGQLIEQTDSVNAAADDQHGDISVISKRIEFWPHPPFHQKCD
jgi:hypothetical protein